MTAVDKVFVLREANSYKIIEKLVLTLIVYIYTDILHPIRNKH